MNFCSDVGTVTAKKLASKWGPVCSTLFMRVVSFHFRECAAAGPQYETV
jgi:hypothetical protein